MNSKNGTFDEESHTYEFNGKELTSVTTWVKSFFPEFDEKRIAQFSAKKHCVTVQTILRRWRSIADRGTWVHQQIEDCLMNRTTKLPPARKRVDKEKVWAAVKWFKENYNNCERICEEKVYAPQYGLAGTVDLRVNNNGSWELIDWKTNENIRHQAFNGEKGTTQVTSHIPNANFYHYEIQLSTYAYILETVYGIPITKLTLVHIDANAEVFPMGIEYRRALVQDMIRYTLNGGKLNAKKKKSSRRANKRVSKTKKRKTKGATNNAR